MEKINLKDQIDAPFTVSGFLQRMGRTGRRVLVYLAPFPKLCIFKRCSKSLGIPVKMRVTRDRTERPHGASL